ncbi:MAG TPA: S1C family serine protease, partial [Planctomycetota bacterium]|nr:S1C family serine protease [Planctomycetota bacterium]
PLTAVSAPSPMARISPYLVDRVYDRVVTAVVAITCRTARGEFFGSGVIIDPEGTVLTSTTVVPRGAARIRVYLRGGRVARARHVFDDSDHEISLIQIRDPERYVPEGASELPYLELGSSHALRLGDPIFTLGNAFHSIERDDQVTVAAGVLSGRFTLEETLSEATYQGEALEFTAALNNGMDGGPLVDGRLRVVGLLSLNFSRARWLGTAVPIDVLKPLIAAQRDRFDDRFLADTTEPSSSRAIAGFELGELGRGHVSVLSVREGGPAETAGLRSGDRVTEFAEKSVDSLDAIRSELRAREPGTKVRVRVLRDGETRDFEIVLGGRF